MIRMQEALDEHGVLSDLNGEVNVAQLCKKHDIKRPTFISMLKKGCSKRRECAFARKTECSRLQSECMLATWVMINQAIGLSVVPEQIRRKALELLRLHNAAGYARELMGKHWMRGFLDRFPFLTPRTHSSLDRSKAQYANAHTVGRFYALLKILLERHTLKTDDGTSRTPIVYNMDESMIHLVAMHESKKVKVIGLKGSRNSYKASNKRQDHVPILQCVGSDGSAIPPMLVFKGKLRIPQLDELVPAGSHIEYTELQKQLFKDIDPNTEEYQARAESMQWILNLSALQVVRTAPAPSRRSKADTGKLSGKAEITTEETWLKKAAMMELEEKTKKRSKRRASGDEKQASKRTRASSTFVSENATSSSSGTTGQAQMDSIVPQDMMDSEAGLILQNNHLKIIYDVYFCSLDSLALILLSPLSFTSNFF